MRVVIDTNILVSFAIRPNEIFRASDEAEAQGLTPDILLSVLEQNE